MYLDSPPSPPIPGVSLGDYLKSVGAFEHWLPWSWLWQQDVESEHEMPQPERYGLVVGGPIRLGDGDMTYVLPIDRRTKTVIHEEFKGHRRALERLAEVVDQEDAISFALLTAMMALVESRQRARLALSPDQLSNFFGLMSALTAYFNTRNLWHHATRKYTPTGFAMPYLADDQ